MKRILYALVGFGWGIFVFNKEIVVFLIFLTFLTVAIDILTIDEK